MKIDISVTSYLFLFSLILLGLSRFIPRIAGSLHKYAMHVVYLVITIIVVADPFFYKYWGMKASMLVFEYSANPAGWKSIEALDYFLAILLLLILFSRYRRRWKNALALPQKVFIPGVVIYMVFAIIGARGGFSNVPLSISESYYSERDFDNYLASNAVWQIVATQTSMNRQRDLDLIDVKEGQTLLDKLTNSDLHLDSNIQFNDSTNIIFIMMESFSSKLSSKLDGSITYMPHLDSIMNHSIYFTNAYALSYRSERGLTGVFTGYPSLPTTSYAQYPSIMDNRGGLINELNKNGYYTSFTYGGDLDFANMRLIVKESIDIYDQKNMIKGPKGTWGYHDEVLFDEVILDLETTPQPFFASVFTLSSHEPYDVPNFKKNTEPFLNSVQYADSCLHVFINNLKLHGYWDNSLIIITADHGVNKPERSAAHIEQNNKIPLVLSGGAIINPQRVDEIVSQIDITSTISSLIGSKRSFEFSKSLLNPKGYAFYNYFNGLVYVSDTCTQFYDIPMGKYLYGQCTEPYEKAYFQLADKQFFKP